MAIKINAPDASAYGAFSPLYGAGIARKSGNPGADVINQLALSFLARGERGGYGAALAGANAAALEAAKIEGGTELAKSYIAALPQLADKGMSGAVQVAQPYITVDQGRADVNDVIAQNAAQQGAFGDTAAGIADLAKVGMAPPMADVGAMITPPIQEEAMTVQPYLTPDAVNDQLRAQAAMISASKPSGGGGGGDGSGAVTMQITDDGFGDPSYTYRGKDPAAVEAAYRAQRGGPSGPSGPGAGGGREVPDVKAQVSMAKGRGATAKAVSRDTVELTFPNGRKTQIKINPDGVTGTERAVR